MHVWRFLYFLGFVATGSQDNSAGLTQHTEIEGSEPSHGKYDIMYSNYSEHGLVQVVRMDVNGHTVDYLLCGRSISGARLLADDLKDHDLFTVFRLLKSMRFLQPQPQHALLLGLGAGIVASYFRLNGIRTDVMEINGGIIEAAHDYFEYDASEESTKVGDARRLLAESRTVHEHRYDLIIHDMHVGIDAAIVLTKELFTNVHDMWLHRNCVFVVNFVGFSSLPSSPLLKEAFALSLSVVATLRSVFQFVKCYREIPLSYTPSAPSNIICLSADKPWNLSIPSHNHAPEMSPDWLSSHFQKWEVLREDGRDDTQSADIITEGTTGKYTRASDIIAVEMNRLAQTELMPHGQFWERLESQLGPSFKSEL